MTDARRPDATSQRSAAVQPGERVVLVEPDTGYVHLVQLDGKGARKQRGLGVHDPGKLAGLAYGAEVMQGAKRVVLVRPTLTDLSHSVPRKAQIILPKDASRIVFELGLGPGDRVLESGIGSGAATLALCWCVGASGKVVSQELREEFAQFAQENVAAAGMADRLEVHIGDLTQGVAPGVKGPFDAVLLDQPEPWLALPHLTPHLAAGARVACYTPQVVQMEAVVRSMREAGFVDVRAMELIERGWEVKERGSRPSFDGLGHTAFLSFGRWLGKPYKVEPVAKS
jgi:tRNA (adenine57-N1/adenine58-N1)-methyltransferase